MRRKMFFSVMILSALAGFAQNNKIKLNSSVATGLIAGATGPALQLQTVNGIKFNTWSAGVGAGLDYYQSRTIPVFLDVCKALSNKANSFFLYIDGGYNFRWLTQYEKFAYADTKGGLYYDVGVGYQLKALKTHKLFFSLGYGAKQISNLESTPIYDMFGMPMVAEYHYKYNLQRWSLKVGLSL